jgi:hypothetical protein
MAVIVCSVCVVTVCVVTVGEAGGGGAANPGRAHNSKARTTLAIPSRSGLKRTARPWSSGKIGVIRMVFRLL